MTLTGKVAIVTGGSRGIGRATARALLRAGASVAITGTKAPHLVQAAAELAREASADRVLTLQADVRQYDAVESAWARVASSLGGIDIVVNNASAVSRTPVAETEMKRFDLMHQINARGTFIVSKYAIPHLTKAPNPHILMNSPPLDMQEKWFAGSTGYSIAKYGMSLVVLGLAGELREQGIAVNALWPRTTIATAAIKNLLGGDKVMRMSRTPEIMADAAYQVFQKPAREFTGHFLIDDTFLAANGITNFEKYRAVPVEPLAPTFFVPDDIPAPRGVSITGTRWD
jgi:citronellol/citronellal dehydrogenase